MSISDNTHIEVHRARVNNLKDLSVVIPRDQLIVITGLSGSGKSSLAFDTLYAEGQRRYVESLSVYARQFVGKMAKPECDYIGGIPPAIAIRQSRGGGRSPRSTVGTTTEVYDYLRMLFARVGKTISPISGNEVRRHTTNDVREWLSRLAEGTRFMVLAPITKPDDRTLFDHLHLLSQLGYTRIAHGTEVMRLGDLNEEMVGAFDPAALAIVVDRLTVEPGNELWGQRVGDSVETAFFEGRGTTLIMYEEAGEMLTRSFSDRFEADGILFEEPTDKFFSFNSPVGACPRCEGFSLVDGIEAKRVIPNERLSYYEGAVMPWRGTSARPWFEQFMQKAVKYYDWPIHRPYHKLTDEERALLWNGDKNHGILGIWDFFADLEAHRNTMANLILLARFKGRSTCPECHGRRLKKEALYVQVGGKNIAELVEMDICDLRKWIDALTLNPEELKVGERLLEELRLRIGLLDDIGLGYLRLDRISHTLSGGESQRIALATSLGSGLIGSLYILDEPSIGLHPRDTHLLIDIVRQLADLGNTVVVVEHDEDMIRAADMIIDIGPDAGRYGGRLVYQGATEDLPPQSESHTVEYLSGRKHISWPKVRRKGDGKVLFEECYHRNLKDITISLPLGVMSVVTGVSGSGKSSFVRDICYEGLKLLLDNYPLEGIPCGAITGDYAQIKEIEYVDQNALGKSSRSNPVTYLGAYDEIRKLFAAQPLAKQMGYTPIYFSFNKEGGRCEYCKGEGVVSVEMQFMADMTIECEECHGKRFSEDLLEVTYQGKNIYEVLEMSVEEAILFFTEHSEEDLECKRIAKLLQPLADVGLGYIKLGQSSSSLSGGESQRLKLASYLAAPRRNKTLFIFDEPTTGLHVHDVQVLLGAFEMLLSKGHSLLIVEHNLEVIKCADYIIDLGPGGGREGGELICEGTPEELMQCDRSSTGQYLKAKYALDQSLLKQIE